MADFVLTDREATLVHAALSQDRVTAVRAWQSWTEAVVLEDAPHPELRLLATVYSNLSRLAPDMALPQRLRGKARATFTYNRLISHEALPALQALEASVPVVVTKGAAFCAQFNALSFRQMGDIDIHVPQRHLTESLAVLTALGWTPKHGMTLSCLMDRTTSRRNSWNLTKQNGDIDLHWRFLDCANGTRLEHMFWDSAEEVDFLGRRLFRPSPEFSAVSCLHHGFVAGTRADALQALIDCRYWLPLCDRDKLANLVSLTSTYDENASVRAAFNDAGLANAEWLRHLPDGRPPPRPHKVEHKVVADEPLIRHRRLYRLWGVLGRWGWLERLILRHFGPISKPSRPSTSTRSEYALHDCAVLDEIGGPGWSWPDPGFKCAWTDQADSRLLVQLPAEQDYVAVFSLSALVMVSQSPTIVVHVNGRMVRTLEFKSMDRTKFAITIPRSLLFGPWVEFSFRATGFGATPFATYGSRRSVPAVMLQMIPADEAATALAVRVPTDLESRVSRGEEPYYSKFKRIQIKIEESRSKSDPRLPIGFDPISYVLLYHDLFNAEVDPYSHFVESGRAEGRVWI